MNLAILNFWVYIQRNRLFNDEVNQSKGTIRFRIETKKSVAEGATFLLSDVMDHILRIYDRQGQLCRVEYPNGQKDGVLYLENLKIQNCGLVSLQSEWVKKILVITHTSHTIIMW